MKLRFSKNKITQHEMISQATSFIQSTTKVHFSGCAQAGTKNDLSPTALMLY